MTSSHQKKALLVNVGAVASMVLALISMLRPEWRPLLPIAVASGTLLSVYAWRQDLLSLRTILWTAILLRLLVFPAPPTLSDDVYRYLWDGNLVLEGINPYSLKPSDPDLEAYREDHYFGEMNSPDYFSVYPPVSQYVFAAAAWIGKAGFWPAWYFQKALFGLAELAALLILARFLAPRVLVLYAWSPLVIVESWSQLHGEALVLGLIAAVLLSLKQQRPALASFLLTLATWVKLWPVVLFPFIWRHQKWSWKVPTAAGVTTILLWLPFFGWEELRHIRESLALYTRSFEFNSGVYYALKYSTTGLLQTLGIIPKVAETAKTVGPVLRYLFLGGCVLLFFLPMRNPVRIFRTVLTLFILCLATIHPWYLTAILLLYSFPPEAFEEGAAPNRTHPPTWSWHFLAVTSSGTYLLYTHGSYWPWVIVGWSGWLLISACQCRHSRKFRESSAVINPV